MVVTKLGKIMTILCIPSALILAGCGGKCSVSGKVTLEGQPVESGFVTFFPEDKNGQSVGAYIVDGQYSIDNITPGKKRVNVSITGVAAAPGSGTPRSRDEANEERLKESKKRPSAAKKTAKPTTIIGNDKIVEVGSGSQTIDIPLDRGK